MDRFIPNRSAIDFDYAHYMLTDGKKVKTNPAISPSQEAYQQLLREVFNMDRGRILAFKNKPRVPAVDLIPRGNYASLEHYRPLKPPRHIPQTPELTLDAPGLLDDYYLNLMDWGSANVLAIALGSSVYLWNATTRSTSELATVSDDVGGVTSVNWAPDGRHIAVGLNNSQVLLWDSAANTQMLTTLEGGHTTRVGSLAWNNNHILTTGSMDGKIINNDVRIAEHVVQTYRGHRQEVCGLKWSASGLQLASGGNDNRLHIWDHRSSNSSTRWLHRLEGHTAAVKALAWCPFQANLLASGGGECIKFYNTQTGSCLNSVDTGSQVCSLLWSKKERELLSAHGFTQSQIKLWKYPSMVKMAELTGHTHTSSVLFMAQSPDGCTVASAAGDEKLKFWNVFGTPQVAKPPQKAAPHPFADINRIHIR